MIHDYRLFWREFRTNFRTTGAVLPSGAGLARALARFVAQPAELPRRILEVGPGTGAVTRHIVAALGPADCLDLVELNERFVQRLQERFQTDPCFTAAADRARVIHSRLEDLPRDVRYDVIVSGLPLNNFSVAEVETILSGLAGLAQTGAVLSFFEYIGVRRLKGALAGPAERARLRGIGTVLKALLAQRALRRDTVWLNVPPAWVHHVRF